MAETALNNIRNSEKAFTEIMNKHYLITERMEREISNKLIKEAKQETRSINSNTGGVSFKTESNNSNTGGVSCKTESINSKTRSIRSKARSREGATIAIRIKLYT